MTVMGVKRICYDRKKDGAHVEGIELHYSFPSKNIEGVGVDNCFIGQTIIENEGGVIPKPGDEIELMYNKWGRVAGYDIR